MGSIGGECLSVSFQLIRQLEEKFTAFIIPLKERHKQKIPLGQIGSCLAGIAVGG